jgi:putative salt-induced outer membrane protein YdiY
MKRQCLLSLIVIAICSTASYADKVSLSDGSIIMGDITSVSDGKVKIKTSFAGDIEFPMGEVVSIETTEAKPVHLSDGSVIQGTIEMKGPNQMEVVRKKGETGFKIDTTEIQAINPPPPPPPKKVKWVGSVVGNLAITDGNSDTKGIGISANMNRRTIEDRINLRAGYFYSENNQIGSRDDQFVVGKYDYFFNKKLFTYLTSRLDRDVIRDLDMRTTAGAGLGYQFIEDELYNLFGELGLSYVNEDYGNSIDDDSYVAGRTALHFDWWILKDRLKFTEDLEIFLGIEDLDDWFAISESGLVYKWTDQWSANAAIRFEYDNTPATGFKSTDTKYILGVGYSF